MANRIWWMQLHKASLKPTNCIAFNIYSSILKPIFMKGYFQRALPRTMSMISLDIASQMVCIMKVLWTVAVQRSITSFWHQWRWSGTKGRKKYFQTKSLTRWNFFLGSCNTSQRRFGSIHCGVWEKKLDWGHLPKHITQMTTSQSTRYSRKALVTKKNSNREWSTKNEECGSTAATWSWKGCNWCEKYHLCAEYSFLILPEEKWFRMTELQRLQHFKKLNTC